jgi:KUP system potassium uptake protein
VVLVIAVLGVSHIVHHPEILKALSPHHALRFMWHNPGTTFIILGAVVLCVTGAEALYADLGHFGKKPIRLAWFSVVMPALTLNYFGQGALLLERPEAVKNPFFLMAPDWALLPLVVLATAATVIASQALITGAFSVTKQVVQLGYLPRLNVQHTSVRETGQIYIPAVNWGLFGAIVLAVVLFRSSSALAAAYGIAVTLDMLITTTLTFFVIRYGWKLPAVAVHRGHRLVLRRRPHLLRLQPAQAVHGGWFPLMIGGVIFTLMMTWKQGRGDPERQAARRRDRPPRASSSRCSSARRCASRARPCSSPPSRARCPTRCCTTSSTTRCCTSTTCSSPCAATRCRGSAWTSASRSSRWATTAGRCPALRLQERLRRAARAGAHAQPRLRDRAHDHQLLPVARRGGAHHRRRHGAPGARSCSRRCTTTPAPRPTS